MSLSRPSNRIEYLDGLRGIAALIVVLGHYNAVFTPVLNAQRPLPTWLVLALSALLNSHVSVYIFFVLSGLVLGQSSVKTKSGLISMIVMRYLRLTFPLLVSLIIAWFWVHEFRDTRLEFQKMAQNPWFEQAFYMHQKPSFMKAVRDGIYGVYTTGYTLFDGPTWTMRKQLVGSILVYALYLLCPARLRWWSVGIFVVVAALGTRFYLGFALGSLLRELWVRGWIWETRWSWLLLGLSLISCAELRFLPAHHQNLLAVAAAGIVFSVMTLPSLKTFLDLAPVQFLGRISFTLYLVHMPLLLSVIAWTYLHIDCPIVFKYVLGLVLFLALSIALAWVVMIKVDEPFARYLHRLKKHPVFGEGRAFKEPTATALI